MLSRYSYPDQWGPREQPRNRVGKAVALVAIGPIAGSIISALGGWSAVIVLPVALIILKSVTPGKRGVQRR